uniref:MOB kinase activator-like 1A n=1 Tax=Nelumbo nucifera TaxID=4432 RepID=A0A822ZI95_NELNU|nr:TPA_asm: hypothetical protein HUJ06_002500 [Nelumbo nucifera]
MSMGLIENWNCFILCILNVFLCSLSFSAVDFFNQVNILYGTLTEFCTPSNCPTMSAGPKYEYRWADGVQIKKPIEVSAPKYVDYLMDWIETQLDDESLFPQKLGTPFPPNFRDVVKTIFKRLFRVYAHIYHSHFQKIVSLKEEAHLNTCFKHFILFTWVSSHCFVFINVIIIISLLKWLLVRFFPRVLVLMFNRVHAFHGDVWPQTVLQNNMKQSFTLT